MIDDWSKSASVNNSAWSERATVAKKKSFKRIEPATAEQALKMMDETIARLEAACAADSERSAQAVVLIAALAEENKQLHKQLTALEKKSAALDKTREELRATSLKLKEHQRLLAKQAKKKS